MNPRAYLRRLAVRRRDRREWQHFGRIITTLGSETADTYTRWSVR